MRDSISPELFIDNLGKFQQKTGATLDIVLIDEFSSSVFRNGSTEELSLSNSKHNSLMKKMYVI